MAGYRVSSTPNGQRNNTNQRLSGFDLSDRRGQESFGLTSHSMHAIFAAARIGVERRYAREGY